MPGRNVIAAIGIDRYTHWSPLANAGSDATGTVALFRTLGFEPIVDTLLDHHATHDAIHSLVTDDLRVVGEDDSLVLFFAGHGYTRKDLVGRREVQTGYIIPVDASLEKRATWIELKDWLAAVARLPAKHILVVLDSCRAGIALERIDKWRHLSAASEEPLSALQSRVSRRIITSALGDQLALDTGPVSGHSLFTGCLIHALKYELRRPDRRVTTGSELGLHVQRRVLNYPKTQQTPDFGAFDYDERGEMVIPLVPIEVEPSNPEASARARPADRTAHVRARLIVGVTVGALTMALIVVHRLESHAPAAERPCGLTIRGHAKEITSDTSITSDVVCLDSASFHIQGTHDLVIKATTARVLVASSIVGEGTPGSAGQSGNDAFHDNQDGCHPSNLMPDAEARASWCTEVPETWKAANDGCRRTPPPDPCEIGGNGGGGEAGAVGPSVIFDVQEPPNLSGLEVRLAGGPGGPGGIGGQGARHYLLPACPDDYRELRPNSDPRQQAFDCPAGRPGNSGSIGPPGRCVVRMAGQDRDCDEFK